MGLLTVGVIITMCAGLVYGQSPQCQKPDECISLLKCKPLRKQLDKPNKTDQDLFLLSKSLTRLHCGSIRVPFLPKVCCPNPNSGHKINSPPSCNTPDDQPGKCINLFSCQHFKNLLQPPVPQEVISFVQSYRCVGIEEHSVCCGPPPTIPRSLCPALVSAFPSDRSFECCGAVRKRFGGLTSYIIDGHPWAIYQHPWAVLIDSELKNGGTMKTCAGTLISARYVVTAAQCTTGKALEIATPISVRLGEYDLDHDGKDCIVSDGEGMECSDEPISIAIETIIPHPKYDPTTKLNDITLIRLKEAAPYTDFIRPICLPTINLESIPNYYPTVAVSWYKAGGYKGKKIFVGADFMYQEKCQEKYGSTIKLGKGEICANGKGICEGDSGAPLVHENRGRSELIGIVSFGFPCSQKGVPGVYTNIYEYIDWIKSHIVA